MLVRCLGVAPDLRETAVIMRNDKLAIYWRATRAAKPAGGIAVFLFSLFISLGFLLFARQRFAATPQACRADTEHSA